MSYIFRIWIKIAVCNNGFGALGTIKSFSSDVNVSPLGSEIRKCKLSYGENFMICFAPSELIFTNFVTFGLLTSLVEQINVHLVEKGLLE